MSIRAHAGRSFHATRRPTHQTSDWPDPALLAVVLAGFLVVLTALIVALVIGGVA